MIRSVCLVWLTTVGCLVAATGAAQQSAPPISDATVTEVTYTFGNASVSRGAVKIIDVGISLYRTSLTAGERAQYATIMGHFADAVFEATDGRHQIRNVNVFLDGQGASQLDIVWTAAGHPNVKIAGGIGTAGGHIVMTDVFTNGSSAGDIDFLSSAANQQTAGYVLAQLWLKFFLGLGDEYVIANGDIAVAGSILADPFLAVATGSATNLNMSVQGDGVQSSRAFDLLEHTSATAQHRLHGVSAWATVARTYGEDAKSGRLVAKRPRTFYPELAAVAPVGTALPNLGNLGALTGGSLSGIVAFIDNFFLQTTLVNEKTATRTAGGTPSRKITVGLAPQVFTWPVDSSIGTLRVLIMDEDGVNPAIGNLNITLTDPTGFVIQPSVLTNAVVQFDLAPVATGTWTLSMSARANEARDVTFNVTGTTNRLNPEIAITLVGTPGGLASTQVTYPNPVILQATFTQGLGIRSAMIEATIASPTGLPRPIKFHDDGVGPDLIGGDGVYSAEYTYNANGTHTIEAVARGDAASLTYIGTSLAPATIMGVASAIPPPADMPLPQPVVRTQSFSFSVAGLAADDHGNTFLQATPAPFTSADVAGRIDTPIDADYYSFVAGVATRGVVQDTVVRLSNVGGAVAPVLTLFDTDGVTVLATGAGGPSGYLQVRSDLVAGSIYFASVAATPGMPVTTYSFSVGGPIPSDSAPLGVIRVIGGGGGGGGGGCFIATAAYGTPLEPRIDVLRAWRDSTLLPSTMGAAFVDTYYRLSPPLADAVAENDVLRSAVRGGLGLLLGAWDAAGWLGLMLGLSTTAWIARRRLRGIRQS